MKEFTISSDAPRERLLMSGNEAAARGAIQAGCKAYFGYPITPQTEITEYMAREMPKLGRVFVQSQSELGSIYMLYGGAASGERTMTSTSGCGLALMGEGISYISALMGPAVLVDVARMGPGVGTGGQHGQTDYAFLTKSPGTGGIHCIVLASWSPQETFDLTQLAFHLADQYLILVAVLTDFIIGRMEGPVELRTLDFGPVTTKRQYAICSAAKKGGKIAREDGAVRFFTRHPTDRFKGIQGYFLHQREKYRRIADTEVRYETYLAEDANLLIASYGSSALMSKTAVDMARAEGLKVGLFRPITVWPFPTKQLREAALRAGEVLVVEDSIGEFMYDVEYALQGRVPAHLLGVWGRHELESSGIIHPERILQEVKSLI